MLKENALPPEQYLIDAFVDHLVTWAIEANAPQESLKTLRHIGRTVCGATTEGHVCIDLDVLVQSGIDAGTSVHARQLLLTTGVVGTADAPGAMPLILDDENRLYLHRYYDDERRLAQRLVAMQTDAMTLSTDAVRQRLNAFFGASTDHTDWPRIAAALALQRKLLIISGGPGTGKTTTIVNLLACLLEDNPHCRIALAAPTGKAAARMQEAVRTRAAHLPAPIQARLPHASFTIHRLLGVAAQDVGFRHHAENPLPVDAVIVDEASMLDIALAAALFDAIPPHARLILLGDKDQLSAVEAGAVFSELSADPTLTPTCIERLSNATGMTKDRITPSLPRKPSGLQDCVVWFREQFRFASDSQIGRLAAHVSAGETEASLALLGETKDASLTWQDEDGTLLSAEALKRMLEAYAAYSEAVETHPDQPALVFEAFDRFRILCAVKNGPRGVDAINRQISQRFQSQLADPRYASQRAIWYPGRPVIIQRNDYALKLFNGDVGIALIDRSDDDKRLMVYFPDNENGFRAIAPSRLPEHETAFAITVHKSQGSEFESILLMMPEAPNRVTTRELLYTAITRARQRVSICASEAVLRHAIASPTQRNSGLSSRIKEAKEA